MKYRATFRAKQEAFYLQCFNCVKSGWDRSPGGVKYRAPFRVKQEAFYLQSLNCVLSSGLCVKLLYLKQHSRKSQALEIEQF